VTRSVSPLSYNLGSPYLVHTLIMDHVFHSDTSLDLDLIFFINLRQDFMTS